MIENIKYTDRCAFCDERATEMAPYNYGVYEGGIEMLIQACPEHAEEARAMQELTREVWHKRLDDQGEPCI